MKVQKVPDYPKLYPGDIAACRGKDPLLWLSQHLMDPNTESTYLSLMK